MKKNGIIGGFRILEEIHSGGQGTLYKAVCETPPFDGIEPGAVVALKVMHVVQDEGGRCWARLQERTDALAKLSHPNVVKYYGCFSEQDSFGDLFVAVMESLDGETLKDRLARNPSGLDADEAVRIATLALKGLAYTSDAGIVHRDVKPSNIFLCNDGGVKLVDFDESYVIDGSIETDNTAGNIYGTFDYMAPEFANPDFHGDVKSDVFSIGVVLHEMLTGEKPYKREERADRQANDTFLSRWANVGNGGENPIRVSASVNRILAHAGKVLLRALDPDREKRYADFTDFYEGLQGIKFRELRNGDNAYRMLRFIGKGGFSEVFKARHVQTGQIVAVKHMLKPGEKFASFARIVRELNDPSIVRVLDSFTMSSRFGNETFLVMDYLPGNPDRSLRDAIRRAAKSESGHLPLGNVLQAFVCYAHGLKILHEKCGCPNNISPSALYYNAVNPDRSAIMDFNWPQPDYATIPHYWWSQLSSSAPEVAVTGCRANAKTDIYALGLSLYEALTGKNAYPPLPPRAEAIVAFYKRAQNKEQPSFDSPVVTSRPKLLALLKDMTNIDPAQRIQDAAEVERRIGEIIGKDFSISDEPIAPLHSDEWYDDGPFPAEELRKLKLIAESKALRKLKRWRMAASFLGGLLIASAFMALFVCGCDSLVYRILADILALVWLALLCGMELKTRRLPNLLTLGGLAVWLAIGFASGGATGLLASGYGAGIGFLIMLAPFLLRHAGAGAVKTVAACCAYIGWGRLLPFWAFVIVAELTMAWGVCIDRCWNRGKAESGNAFPCSPALAVAALAVIVFKWIGWIA